MAEFCSQCRAPIDTEKLLRKRLIGKEVCDLCFDLFSVVHDRQFFLDAQVEYEQFKKQIDRLRPGRDYFP